MRQDAGPLSVEISFCVVNTEQRGLLRYCLDAIARERATVDFETEVLVLDNASQDGSADVARQHPVTTEVIALTERRGKGVNDSELLRRARGRFCLLLNEDSELEPGATVALHAALASDERAGAAGAMLVRPDGEQQPSAWRFPSPGTALMTAMFLHKQLVVQSTGDDVRPVDWVQSAAMLVRREAAVEIGFFDPQFFVYSDEVDFCRRLAGAGWHTLYVPVARAVAPRAALDRQRPDAADRRVLPQPRPLHAQAPLGGLGGARPLPDRLRVRAAHGAGRSSYPGTIRSATPSTSRRRCGPTAARASPKGAEEFNRQLKGPRA